MVLFYDERDLPDKISRYLTSRLLDIYVWKKKEEILDGKNLNEKDSPTTEAFEDAFSLILENVLLE